MSYRKEKVLSLTGTEVNALDQLALQKECANLLNSKMHGICFSPYEGEQEPGDPISEEQVRRKLTLLQPRLQTCQMDPRIRTRPSLRLSRIFRLGRARTRGSI